MRLVFKKTQADEALRFAALGCFIIIVIDLT